MLSDGNFLICIFNIFHERIGILLNYFLLADALGLTPSDDYTLAIRALGACIWYLTDSLLDIQIMEMSNFTKYDPPDINVKPAKIDNRFPSNMVLDATTLSNLRIVGEDSSLISKLDHCATAMGKRYV